MQALGRYTPVGKRAPDAEDERILVGSRSGAALTAR